MQYRHGAVQMLQFAQRGKGWFGANCEKEWCKYFYAEDSRQMILYVKDDDPISTSIRTDIRAREVEK